MSYTEALTHDPGKLRVGLCETTFDGHPLHPDVRDGVVAAGKLLESLGHHVEPYRPQADHQAMMQAWTKIVACGTALSIRSRLSRLGRALRQGDVQGIARGALAYADTISGADYLEAIETVHAYGREMAHALEPIDVLVSATLAEPPAKIGRFHHEREDFAEYRTGPGGVFDYSPFCAAFNASGQPAVSVPLHWTPAGLPVGIHIAASFGDDTLLMSLAVQLEQAAPWADRKPVI